MPKVRFNGTQDERSITKADWKSVGVDDGEAMRWNRGNRFIVDVDAMSAEMAAFFAGDSDFSVNDDDAKLAKTAKAERVTGSADAAKSGGGTGATGDASVSSGSGSSSGAR